MASTDEQVVPSKPRRMFNSKMRGPQGSNSGKKLPDDNDNYAEDAAIDSQSVVKELHLVQARLRSINEEKVHDEEKKSDNVGVEPPRHRRYKSLTDDTAVVGSAELRRKLSDQFLLSSRKFSAPSLDSSADNEGVHVTKRNKSLGDQEEDSRKEGLGGFVVIKKANGVGLKVERESGQDAEKKDAKEGEAKEAEAGKGELEAAPRRGMTRRLAKSVKRIQSIRFKSKKDKDDDGKGKNEDERDEEGPNNEEETSRVNIVINKGQSDCDPNQEIVKELSSSMKFKGHQSIPGEYDSIGDLMNANSKSSSVSCEGVGSRQSGEKGEEGKKFSLSLKSLYARSPKMRRAPPFKPKAVEDEPQDDPAGAAGSNEDIASKESKETEIPPVYATLCPPEEDEGSISDALSQNTDDNPDFEDTLEDTSFEDSGIVAKGHEQFADHVYEDVEKVMKNVRLPPLPVEAYQISNVSAPNVETVQPVLYDELPTSFSTFKPAAAPVYDQPQLSPVQAHFTPSRENSWTPSGENIIKNPSSSVTRNWATRLPNENNHQGGGGYDVPAPQAAPRLSQKSHLAPAKPGSTPHSPTTAGPNEDNGVPPGWRVEQTVSGDPVFINESTLQKWYKTTPKDGEPYYYSEDRSQTGWELPAVANSVVTRRRMASEGGGGGGGDDSRLPSLQSRHDEARPLRPISFHPQLHGSSSPNLPSQSRFLDVPAPSQCNDQDWASHERQRSKKRKGKKSMSVHGGRVSVYDSSPMNEIVVREKEGTLTLVQKDKGRQRKGRPGYGVLAGSLLKYYKDLKHYERDPNSPEYNINLWRADVCWIRGRGPRRLIFELTSDQITFILQGEDEASSMSWFEAIRGAVPDHRRLKVSPDDSEGSPSPLSPGGPGVPPPSYPEVQSQDMKKKNIREKLKIFIKGRPEKDDLKRKGILQEENVFGRHIIKLCDREQTLVPNFVMDCIRHIDRSGLHCDGIYRVSGNLSMIQKLRFQVDQEKPVDLETSPWKEDIHVITGSLKLYFRELPEPLFTFATYERFIAAMTQINDIDQRIKAFSQLFREMPRVNQETIATLFLHLKRVMDNVQHNRMPAKNLATVFGPTLMWPERENMNMTMATFYQNQVMEFILNEFDSICR